MDNSEITAQCIFQASDVQTLRPEWTDTQCEEWLFKNSKYIEEAMSVAGWSAMENLLPNEE